MPTIDWVMFKKKKTNAFKIAKLVRGMAAAFVPSVHEHIMSSLR